MIDKHPIGLFGGTFDPIHRGHIKIADELVKKLKLHTMHFIPNKDPIYRQKPTAHAEHRLAMVRIATMQNPQFIVNDVEIYRSGPTYSIDTIKAIREKIPQHPLCLILGKDAFTHMNHWYQWESIPKLVHLVIINRPGVPLSCEPWMESLLKKHEVCDMQKLHLKPGGYILQQDIKPITISATEIRKKLKKGEKNLEDMDPKVLRYIMQHHLYHS